MGACDDEKAIFEQEAQAYLDATNNYNDASDDYMDALNDARAAEADRARCGDDWPLDELIPFCADEEAAEAAAEAREAAEARDRQEANERLEEALFWLDTATDLYCDCLAAHPDG